MAMNQQYLQSEWRSSWRSTREDENASGGNEWMDVSEEEEDRREEEEDWRNPGKEDERMEEVDPQEPPEDGWESEKTAECDERCSFSVTPANRDSAIAMCSNNAEASTDDVKCDNNNNVEVCINCFAVNDHLCDCMFKNEASDDEDDADESHDEGKCSSFSGTSTNSGSFIAVHTSNYKADEEENADKYDDKNRGESSKGSPVTSAESNSSVAAIINNEEDASRNYNTNIEEHSLPVMSNSDGLVNDDSGNFNGNEKYTKSLAVASGKVKYYYKYENDDDDESFAAASISTDDIGDSFRNEEQQMTDSEQELVNQELEEEHGDDEDECDGNDSCEGSDDDDCDIQPKKLYSDPAYPGSVFQALENMMEHSVFTDLTLCTEDGHQFQVHSSVLAAVSCLIQTQLSQKPRQEQFIILCLGPEVHGSALAAVIEFAYTGTIANLSKDNLKLVRSAAVSLEALRVLELCKEEEQREEDKERGKKEERKRMSAEEHMSVNLQYIRQLWSERVGCDVELEAEGRVFHAHRVILVASSDYFRGMFTSGMKESRQELVSLLLVSAAKFEALLHYSYSGALALGWGCVFDLTCTSLQLQFQAAFSLCLNFLHQEIDAYSCLDVASFAEAYGMEDLLALANDFVLRHFEDVSITPKFKDLPVEKLKKYLQSDSLCVHSELPVFKAVMAWIEAFPRQRVKLARELMRTIQFHLMTYKEFKEVKSITSWPRIEAKKLYKSLLEEFCSSSSDVQSNFRVYVPKDTLVLVGGERITDNLDKRRPCREMWFSNSLQNHVGLVKKVEWRILGTLPEKPRFSHGVGAMKGKLYVVGGRHYYGKDDTMKCTYRYDPIQNSWQRLADMQEKRGSFTLVVLNGKIYAIGGERDSDINMDSVEAYCPNKNTWSFVHPLDQTLCCHAASIWNDTIFLSGGFDSQYHCLSSMILYHPELGSTYLAEMRNDRALHCMETLRDRLYVAGGVSCKADGHLVDQLACEVYDPVANSWSAITSFPVPHVGAASAVLEGKVYVIGGYSNEDYSDTKSVHRYDPATECWEYMSVTPGPNTYIAACVLAIPRHLRQ